MNYMPISSCAYNMSSLIVCRHNVTGTWYKYRQRRYVVYNLAKVKDAVTLKCRHDLVVSSCISKRLGSELLQVLSSMVIHTCNQAFLSRLHDAKSLSILLYI